MIYRAMTDQDWNQLSNDIGGVMCMVVVLVIIAFIVGDL